MSHQEEWNILNHPTVLLEPFDGNKKIILYFKHLHKQHSCRWFPLFPWQCPTLSALSILCLLPFASPAKKPSFFLQIVLTSLFRQSLFPPSAPSLPPLLHQALSLYWCPSPFFSLYSGLIVLVLPYWNQATCTRLSECHRRDIESRRRWFHGAQADSSTIPGGMPELWCQAGLSPSHQQHGLWKRGLCDFLSYLRKPLTSVHKPRLSHLGSLARVKQQTPPPYQATPIPTPAPNRGKQDEFLKELSVIRQHNLTAFSRLLLRKASDVWLKIFKQVIPEAQTWWGLFSAKQLKFGNSLLTGGIWQSFHLAVMPAPPLIFWIIV